MTWKIALVNYGTAFVSFVVWFVAAVLSGWFFDVKGEIKGGMIAITTFILVVLFLTASITASIQIKAEIGLKTKAMLPNFKVFFFPHPQNAVTTNGPTLQRFSFSVENTNPSSEEISDFIIRFYFSHPVVKIEKAILSTSEAIQHFELNRRMPDNSIKILKSLQDDIYLNENIVFSIRKVKLQDQEVNTNVTVLSCKSWPKGVSIVGTVIIDTSMENLTLSLPENRNTYAGSYNITLYNELHPCELRGLIPFSIEPPTHNLYPQMLEFWIDPKENPGLFSDGVTYRFVPPPVKGINWIVSTEGKRMRITIEYPLGIPRPVFDDILAIDSSVAHMINMTNDGDEIRVYLDAVLLFTMPL